MDLDVKVPQVVFVRDSADSGDAIVTTSVPLSLGLL